MSGINWAGFEPAVNRGANRNNLELASDFTREDIGIFRVLQLAERSLKVASYVLKSFGNSLSVYFDKLADKFATSWQMLAIPRIPGIIDGALKSIEALRNDDSDDIRPIAKMVANVSDAGAGCGYAASAVLGVVEKSQVAGFFKGFADVFDLTYRFASLQMTAEDFLAAGEAAEAVKSDPDLADVHNNFVETRRYNFVKLAENSAGIFCGMAGMGAIVLGGPLLPSITLTLIGLGRTITAMGNQYYKDTRDREIVNMYSARMSLLIV